MKLKRLLVITARALIGQPTFMPTEWSHFSKQAYFEPIVVRDGFHDFVLMGAPDYAEMQSAHALHEGLSKASKGELERFAAYLRSRDQVQAEIDAPTASPDIQIVAGALAQMAKTPAPCRCQAAGRIICSPHDRC